MQPVLWLELAGGLALLFVAGEAFVRGAVGLAKGAGMSELLIGLTVVALGTSAPEFFVSLEAVLRGRAQIAIANVTGSNVINLTLVLGLAAIVAPLAYSRGRFALDAAVVVASAAVLTLLGLFGSISRAMGLAMICLLAGYVVTAYLRDRRRRTADRDWHSEECEEFAPFPPLVPAVGLAVGGLAGLILGGHLVVGGAEGIATALGASETVVGLTVVAAGSSLPELATSLVAAIRGHTDVAIGNILGSCIFNVLWILGVCAIVRPFAIDPSLARSAIPLMLAAAIAVSALVLLRSRIGRVAGTALAIAYAAYVFVVVRIG